MKKIILSLSLILSSSLVFAAANEQSFTPDSILVSILSVTIPGGGELYVCDGTGDECLVDVADPTALAALTTDASIDVGTHNTIEVGTCKSEGEHTAFVRGTVVLGGTTYYTTSGADVLSTNIADLDHTPVVFSGCSNEFNIPGGLTIAESEVDTPLEGEGEEQEGAGAVIDFNLFISIKDIAWANLSTATIPGGCKEGSNGSVCMAYPDVVPSVGSVTPIAETYKISDTANVADSGGQILCIFDENDKMLGGFSRRYFSPTSQAMSANFDTGFRTFSENPDGTLNFDTYGGSATSSYLSFENFSRSTHSGTYSSPEGGGSTQSYTATMQP